MRRKSFSLKWLLLVILGLSTFTACNDDEPVTGNNYVNNWIYDNMDFWYYWNSQLPKKSGTSANPSVFFENLLNAQDRFSIIHDDYEELLNSLSGISKEAGYEFLLYLESEGSTNVIAQIIYIKPGSPAASTALKRGDYITHVNNTRITTSNYRDLLDQMGENHSITYKAVNTVDKTFGAPTNLSLQTVEVEENPNFFYTVFDHGEKKIGYYVYHFFAPGIGEGEEYNNQMNQIFDYFKAQSITDLIVDFRYNGGGYVSSSIHLASLLGKNIDATKVFTKREYNSDVTSYFKLTEQDLVEKFTNQPSNIGNQLAGNLYILTSTRTASASELVINGLRPFMTVTLIGDKTVGKNVGSIPIYDESNLAKNRWIMLPIVVKSFNSANQSNYSTGFIPDFTVEEGAILYPYGSDDDPLLSAAISQITGGSGRTAIREPISRFGALLGTSRELRKGGLKNPLIDNSLTTTQVLF
jgi:carboxyl-terminal processing protease